MTKKELLAEVERLRLESDRAWQVASTERDRARRADRQANAARHIADAESRKARP